MVAPAQHTDGQLAGIDGTTLYWQTWTPAAPRGLVVLVHGMGEHSSRYGHVAEALTAKGFAVHAHDHRGHGRSGGKRSFIDRMDNLVADIGIAFDHGRAAVPDGPVVMLGHSMGGLSSALWAEDNRAKLDALALSGPLAALDAANPVTRIAAKVLSAAVPSLPLIAVDASALSHDPQVGADYRADPLIFAGKLPARTVGELAAGVAKVQANASKLTMPLLVQHGELDTLAPPAGSLELFEKAASTDKKRIVYPGMYHEIFNEVDRAQVLGDLTDWLEQHFPA
ncbi:alpha/beta hydrolase [Tomitella biformata]|uniref:alpha/beta hydrolase n=1 Tax=Tomitella biformata TaxID=630403 RepID=UPI000466F112|nr:alpha/beta hydrolase [Tomitella biformata]